MTNQLEFLTSRQAAKRGPLPEFRIRAMIKEGRVPGFYAGNRFLINYPLFLESLQAECLSHVSRSSASEDQQ